MSIIKRIKLNCPKCKKDFYLDGDEIKFYPTLKFGIEKIVLHCVCKKCNVKLEVDI